MGTFCWNHQQNLEAYWAIPCMGAVNHTLNIRSVSGTTGVHHQSRRRPRDHCRRNSDSGAGQGCSRIEDGGAVHRRRAKMTGRFRIAVSYEDIVAAEQPGFEWPELDEKAAAAMCYTSGTTGNPKGVAVHASLDVHPLRWRRGRPRTCGVTEHDRLLMIPPMFHANAWGLPYLCVDERRGHDHARTLPASRAVVPHDGRRAPDDDVRCADDFERHSSLQRDASGGFVVAAVDDLRRRRSAARADRKISPALRRQSDSGLGDDGNKSAGRDRCAAARHSAGTGDRFSFQDRTGSGGGRDEAGRR